MLAKYHFQLSFEANFSACQVVMNSSPREIWPASNKNLQTRGVTKLPSSPFSSTGQCNNYIVFNCYLLSSFRDLILVSTFHKVCSLIPRRNLDLRGKKGGFLEYPAPPIRRASLSLPSLSESLYTIHENTSRDILVTPYRQPSFKIRCLRNRSPPPSPHQPSPQPLLDTDR